jgi:hypothetical protein
MKARIKERTEWTGFLEAITIKPDATAVSAKTQKAKAASVMSVSLGDAEGKFPLLRRRQSDGVKLRRRRKHGFAAGCAG